MPKCARSYLNPQTFHFQDKDSQCLTLTSGSAYACSWKNLILKPQSPKHSDTSTMHSYAGSPREAHFALHVTKTS